eukprot:14659_1
MTMMTDYIVVSIPLSYYAAHKHCINKFESSLVSIHSFEENNIISDLCFQNQTHSCWIGLDDTDRTGQWTWIDGSSYDYDNWDISINETNKQYHCSSIQYFNSDAYWIDENCLENKPFLCYDTTKTTTSQTDFNNSYIVLIVCLAVGICCVLAIILKCYLKKSSKKKQSISIPTTYNINTNTWNNSTDAAATMPNEGISNVEDVEIVAVVINEYGYKCKLIIDGYIRRIQKLMDDERNDDRNIRSIVPVAIFVMCFNFYYIPENDKPPAIKKKILDEIENSYSDDSYGKGFDGWRYW